MYNWLLWCLLSKHCQSCKGVASYKLGWDIWEELDEGRDIKPLKYHKSALLVDVVSQPPVEVTVSTKLAAASFFQW